MVSWVNPDATFAQKTFDDYLRDGPFAALDAIEKATGEREVNTIGFCLGGTLLACLLGVMAAKKDLRIKSATFFASLIDFSEPGELEVFIDEQQVAQLEQKMRQRGYLEGSEMATTFNMLRANDLIWSFVVNNYLLGKQPFPFDLLYWNSDSTRMPAAMHSFYLRNMYLNNLLRKPGGITLDNVAVDLSKVRTPCTSRPPSKTISRPGIRPTRAPGCFPVKCALCSAAPDISPASSTRRQPASTAIGPMNTSRTHRRPGSKPPASTPGRGGTTGRTGSSHMRVQRCLRANLAPASSKRSQTRRALT